MVLPGNPAPVAAAPLAKVSSGITGVLVKFVVPVAGFCGGYAMGLQIVAPLADFITDFIPFARQMDAAVKARSSSTLIAYEIAALLIISISVVIAYLVMSFMGGGFLPQVVAVGVGAFGIGVGIRGIVEGFGPAKAAMAAVGDGTTTAITTTTTTAKAGTEAAAAASTSAATDDAAAKASAAAAAKAAELEAQRAANEAAIKAREAERARGEAERRRAQIAAEEARLIEERRRSELAAQRRERERQRGTGREGRVRI